VCSSDLFSFSSSPVLFFDRDRALRNPVFGVSVPVTLFPNCSSAFSSPYLLPSPALPWVAVADFSLEVEDYDCSIYDFVRSFKSLGSFSACVLSRPELILVLFFSPFGQSAIR